jgi:hypothetical protein
VTFGFKLTYTTSALSPYKQHTRSTPSIHVLAFPCVEQVVTRASSQATDVSAAGRPVLRSQWDHQWQVGPLPARQQVSMTCYARVLFALLYSYCQCLFIHEHKLCRQCGLFRLGIDPTAVQATLQSILHLVGADNPLCTSSSPCIAGAT